jgi:hypothetical protein
VAAIAVAEMGTTLLTGSAREVKLWHFSKVDGRVPDAGPIEEGGITLELTSGIPDDIDSV